MRCAEKYFKKSELRGYKIHRNFSEICVRPFGKSCTFSGWRSMFVAAVFLGIFERFHYISVLLLANPFPPLFFLPALPVSSTKTSEDQFRNGDFLRRWGDFIYCRWPDNLCNREVSHRGRTRWRAVDLRRNGVALTSGCIFPVKEQRPTPAPMVRNACITP